MARNVDWYLTIPKKEFKKIYAGTSVLKDMHLFETQPNTDNDMLINYMSSKLWRLNSLYGIRDKFGTPLKFNMNRAQHKTYAQALKHPRMIILKSRQQGISTFWLVSFFDDAITLDNLIVGLMAQDKDAASDLLERVDWAWDDMDPGVLAFLGVERTVNNSKETAFSNGSKIFVRTSFRSGTLQRLHISELGKIANKYPEKAKETNTGSLQTIKAGNPVIIESTAEGKDNMFAHKWKKAEELIGARSPMHFAPLFLSWVDDPDCNIHVPVRFTKEDREYFQMVERDLEIDLSDTQRWWAAAKRDELLEEFDREYPYNPESAFAQSRDGTYYGRMIKTLKDEGRVMKDLFDPALKVVVSFDLGISDSFEMLFWQKSIMLNGRVAIYLIDHYHNTGEGLSHYVKVLRDKNYKYERFILPHDAKKRELGAAKSISGQLRDLGLNKQRVLPLSEILAGIQAMREIFPLLYIDADRCDYVISAFENYTKEWDDARGVWKDKPRHDEWSNPADAARYYALSLGRFITGSKKRSPGGPGRRKNKSNVVDKLAL